MELWENDDETPYEERPGYLGLTCDGDLLAGSELQPLKEFDIRRYSELVDEHGGRRQFALTFPTGAVTIEFNAYDGFADLLGQLPTIEFHDEPPADSPASSSIRVFFVADGVSELHLKESIAALASALWSDFRSLEANT